MSTTDRPFMRVWPHGGVSLFVPSDRRAWPICAAMALVNAKLAPNEYMRMHYLRQAEWMATRRQPLKSWRLCGDWVKLVVNTCDLCGKRGVFLSGDAGRCRQHKAVSSARVEANRVRADQQRGARTRDFLDGKGRTLRAQARAHPTRIGLTTHRIWSAG